MKSKNLRTAFVEAAISATAAHLGAWGLLITVDRLVNFCGHVVTIVAVRSLGVGR
jgi:hypothetical protein